MTALNRASRALEAHTSLTTEECSASLVEVASTQSETDPAPSMTVRSKVSLDSICRIFKATPVKMRVPRLAFQYVA